MFFDNESKKSELIDGRTYNLGAVNVTWSSEQGVFLGGNFFVPLYKVDFRLVTLVEEVAS
jgi:hypothetical protein